jgi:hypothetical protein
MLSNLFTKQNNPSQILESLLIALSFTSPLESRHIKSIIKGFVFNERFYINNQKQRGYLKSQAENEKLILTPKAKRRAHSHLIELTANTKGGIGGQLEHEVLLSRSLFLCLLHLRLADIRQIKKQKRSDNNFIHDLTIRTQNQTLCLEVDRGNQPASTLEAKINSFKFSQPEGQLIYFTDSSKTYSQFAFNPNATFIYLHSSTLQQDLLAISFKAESNQKPSPDEWTASSSAINTYQRVLADPVVQQPHNPSLNNQDVFNNNPLLYSEKAENYPYSETDLSSNWEQRHLDLIKILNEDF